MINTENIESKFHALINTNQWNKFRKVFSQVDDVYIIGNGGNWAVGSHGACDNFKMSKNKKFFSLDSSAYITAASNDWGYENLFLNWLKHHNKNNDLINKSMIIESLGYRFSRVRLTRFN